MGLPQLLLLRDAVLQYSTSAGVGKHARSMLVGEAVEHTGGEEPVACFECILDRRVLDVDEDFVRVVGGAEDALNA